MGRRVTRRWVPAFCCLLAFASIAQAQKLTLSNGIVRLDFDEHTGLFQTQSLRRGVLRLFDAGPSFQIGDKNISPPQATKIAIARANFTDSLGQGEKLVVQYSFSAGTPNLRYELALYKGEPWLSAVGYLAEGDYRLQNVSVLRGKVNALSSFRSRVYINSGSAYGGTGVWSLGLRMLESADLSVLYEPRVGEALGLGFYSFYRASTSISVQYLNSHEIGVDAAAHYYGYAPTRELRTESLLLNLGSDPLKILDQWADAVVKTVHPKFDHDTRRGYLNIWFMYGDRTTDDETLHQAELLRRSALPGYGITSVGLGEWQYQRPETGNLGDNYGFGENRVDPRLHPQGVGSLATKIIALGLHPTFGANYVYAAPRSAIAEAHEPWIDWSDSSRLDFGYPIDFTDPRALQWLFEIAHRTLDYHAVEWWADFNGGPTRGRLHDPSKIMQFEDIREGLMTIRRAIGPTVAIHQFCCGPYFPDVGLVDRVRVGPDAPALGDWQGFEEMARHVAANYMLHQRVWINDPDALFVGGQSIRDMGSGPVAPDSAMLSEVRMRLQEQMIGGGPVTIGESLADLTPKKLRLLTLVLPSYGEAARPLDLFVHSTPEVYDLPVKAGWDSWHVLLIQNWTGRDKSYEIEFRDLGLDSNQPYLVYSFWDQHLLGRFRGRVCLNAKAKEGGAFAIRPVPHHPWVLSTDMQLTQGGVELQSVRYDEASRTLSGVASRNADYSGQIVLYAPAGYRVRSASAAYRSEQQPSGAEVIYLKVNFSQTTLPWSMTFDSAN